jgi:hypothetical protein
MQLRSEDLDVASLDAHGSAESFEASQMQVDRPISNDAASWQ